MNKTLSINLNSLVFQIDEHAYEKLSNYLKTIAIRFEGTEGSDEIISDIEARIAEMFSEKLSNTKQVISMADVESVIETMGRPEEFDRIEDEMEEEEPKRKSYPRKLFRDTENSVIGGVCSGISTYLGISDPIFLRLIFLIAFFGFGTGFLLYIILWVVIPEAKTASDKLHMRGEPINVSNIEKTITEEFDDIKKSLKSDKASKSGGIFKNLLMNIVRLLVNLIMIFAKILGVILIIVASIVLMTFITGGFAAALSSDVPLLTLSDYFFANTFHEVSSFIVIILLVMAPLLMFIYLGLRFLGGNRFNIRGFSKTLTSIFVVAVIGLFALTIYTSSLFYKSASGSQKIELEEPASGKFYLKGDFSPFYSSDHSEFMEFGELTFHNGQLLLGDRIQLDIVKSMDNNAYLEVVSKAKGSSRQEAYNYQNSIQFEFEQEDSILNIPYYMPIEKGQKIRGQKIQLHLHLPVGTAVYLDHSSDEIIYDIKNVTNTYDGHMLGHTWQMMPMGLTCVDCQENKFKNDFSQKKDLHSLDLLGSFSEVEMNGAYNLKIVSGPFSLKTNDDDIEYTISNNKIVIENQNTGDFFDNNTEVIIQMPELSILELNSVADATIKGFNSGLMEMYISGANKCMIDVEPEKLKLQINGAAKVNLTGKTEDFDLEINGASNFNGSDFKSKNAVVAIAGASKADIWVEESLNAEVSGASKLKYKGLPKIISDVSGFSSIKPIQ